MKEVLLKVRRVRSWLVLLKLLEHLVRFAFYGLSVFALVALTDRLVSLDVDLYKVLFGCLAAALPASVLALLFARITLLKAAIRADERLALKERLSSVIALSGVSSPMEEALVADAQAAARRLDVVNSFPPTLPREARWFFAPAAVVLVTLLLLPPMDAFGWKSAKAGLAKKKVEAQKQAEKIEKKAREIREKFASDKDLKDLKDLDKTLKDMDNIAKEMKEQVADKKETMAKLSSLADELKKRQSESADKEARKNQIQKDLAKNLKDADPNMGEMEKALRDGDMEKAMQEVEKVKEQIQKGNLSKDDQKKLADQLDSLAKALKDNGALDKLAKDLEKAADALKKDDLGKNKEDQKYAEQKMQELAEDFKDLNQGREVSAAEQEMLEQMLNEMENMKDELADGENGEEGEEGECQKCGKKMSETGGT
ncbi:MAG: hypothetical protein HYZ53_01390 [Planctomycetes bacterium]|nr:hypothetical protein [Planctomycetota bacterium]